MKEGRKDWKREGGLKENLIDRQAAAAAHSSFHSSRNHSPFSENSGGKDPKSSSGGFRIVCLCVLFSSPRQNHQEKYFRRKCALADGWAHEWRMNGA